MENIKRDWQQISPIWIEGITFDISPQILWIRDAFKTDTHKILSEQKNVKRAGTDRWVDGYEEFIQTTNGDIIINPEIKIIDWKVIITNAKIWQYETYHAFNNLRWWNKNNEISIDLESHEYEVLSAGGIFYDPGEKSFFVYKRPDDSQEAAGQIDILGGCMNTSDWINEEGKIDPAAYTASRLSTKGWIYIDPDTLEFMWVQKFKERGFYNLVYLAVLKSWDSRYLNLERVTQIHFSHVERYMKQDNPGWAGLSLVLSHPMFLEFWYGPDVMKQKIFWETSN